MLSSRARSPEQSARALFKTYAEYQQSSDPRLADLFDDSALIKSTLRDGTPSGKTVQLAAPRYKSLMRVPNSPRNRPSDTLKYSDEIYSPESGNRVRVSAKRHSRSSGEEFPTSLLVGPDADGTWRIFEEISEFRP